MTKQLPVPDFEALGLAPPQAAVLAYVLEAQQATAAQICAATGLSVARASTTINGLIGLELLDRVRGRRPSVVFIHPDAAGGVHQLSEAAARRRDESRERAERAAAAVVAASGRSADRGRPMYEIRLGVDPLSPTYGVTRWGRESHDQVLVHTASSLQHWGPSPHCHTRLLVVCEDGTQALDALRDRWRAPRHRTGLTVRTTSQPRAELLVLDTERVRITAGSDQGRVVAWSREPPHARAAAELFELWWADASPCFEVPPLSPWAGDEPEWDVEEWDEPDADEPERYADERDPGERDPGERDPGEQQADERHADQRNQK